MTHLCFCKSGTYSFEANKQMYNSIHVKTREKKLLIYQKNKIKRCIPWKGQRGRKTEYSSLRCLCSFLTNVAFLAVSRFDAEPVNLRKMRSCRYNLVIMVGGLWTKGKSNKTHFYLKVLSLTERRKKISNKSNIAISTIKRIE